MEMLVTGTKNKVVVESHEAAFLWELAVGTINLSYGFGFKYSWPEYSEEHRVDMDTAALVFWEWMRR